MPPSLPWRDDLLRLHRSRAGGEAYDRNQLLDGYYDRFLEAHPAWFVQDYERKPPNMCYPHLELIEQVVRDARDCFDNKDLKPGAIAAGDYFAVGPMRFADDPTSGGGKIIAEFFMTTTGTAVCLRFTI